MLLATCCLLHAACCLLLPACYLLLRHENYGFWGNNSTSTKNRSWVNGLNKGLWLINFACLVPKACFLCFQQFPCLLLLAACYLLLSTCYLVLATSYLLLAIWYLLLVSCYLLLNTGLVDLGPKLVHITTILNGWVGGWCWRNWIKTKFSLSWV